MKARLQIFEITTEHVIFKVIPVYPKGIEPKLMLIDHFFAAVSLKEAGVDYATDSLKVALTKCQDYLTGEMDLQMAEILF